MMHAATARRIPALLRLPLGFNILFLCVNGVFMLIAPKTWYQIVPGVSETGFFNQHFVRDIGIVQLFLGAAFAWGAVRPAQRPALWAAARPLSTASMMSMVCSGVSLP